ncbi:MAG: DUF502 domain-containing protein [Candidatus Nitrospinota bacterium M3_3B_026]
MRSVWNILLKGLAAILPVGLTFYLIYWLGVSLERILRPVISFTVPDEYYVPGMGLLAGMAALFAAGLMVNAWIVRRVIETGEAMLERIPLVKSIYGALRDFMDYFSVSQEGGLENVVMVSIGEARMIGFLTREKVDSPKELAGEGDTVAVYLPMSYQVGGYTLYLPRSSTQPVDIPVEDAMRLALTAGLSKRGPRVG